MQPDSQMTTIKHECNIKPVNYDQFPRCLTLIIPQLIFGHWLMMADGQSESESGGNNHLNCLDTCYYLSSPGH